MALKSEQLEQEKPVSRKMLATPVRRKELEHSPDFGAMSAVVKRGSDEAFPSPSEADRFSSKKRLADHHEQELPRKFLDMLALL